MDALEAQENVYEKGYGYSPSCKVGTDLERGGRGKGVFLDCISEAIQ